MAANEKYLTSSNILATFGNSSNGEHDCNNIASNGLWYYNNNGPATSLGASTTDGALYSQAYSTSWVGQIAQDYRNGHLFVRGKNNGSWTSWLKVWDSGNLTPFSTVFLANTTNFNANNLVADGTQYTTTGDIGSNSTGWSNFPTSSAPSGSFGLLHLREGGYPIQLFHSYYSADIWFRYQYWSSSGKSWGSWYKIYNSGNLTAAVITGLLGTTTYAPYIANGYIPTAGGNYTGPIFRKMNVDTSNFEVAVGWRKKADDTVIASIGYHNTVQKIYLNPIGSSEIYSDAVGKYSLAIGNNSLTYNTYPILHSNNYTSYVNSTNFPGLAGVRSATINGNYLRVNTNGTNADLTIPYATQAGRVTGSYTSNGGQQNPNYFGTNKVGFLMMNTTVNGNSNYKDWIIMDCYNGNDVGGGVAFGVNRQALGAYIMRSGAERTSWAQSAELIGTHNYTTYAVPTGRTVNGKALSANITLSLDDVADGSSRKLANYVSKAGDMMTGTLTVKTSGTSSYNQGIRINRVSTSQWALLLIGKTGDSTSGTGTATAGDGAWLIGTPASSNSLIFNLNNASESLGLCLKGHGSTDMKWNNNTVWCAGNDGSGSGLDADLLDGQHGSYYAAASSLGNYLPLTGGVVNGTITANTVHLNRVSAATYGRLGFYSSSYYTWYIYMSQTNAASPTGANAPSGTYVTSWALRSLIENQSGYGWTWESCANGANNTPSIKMELSSYSGNLKISGAFVSAGDQTISSDATLKTNLKDICYSIEDIANAPAVTFDWKDKEKGSGVGSIAQYWKKVEPSFVHGEEGDLSLAYGQLGAVNSILLARDNVRLNKEISELREEIAELKKLIKEKLG